jgi:hypothetical protein
VEGKNRTVTYVQIARAYSPSWTEWVVISGKATAKRRVQPCPPQMLFAFGPRIAPVRTREAERGRVRGFPDGLNETVKANRAILSGTVGERDQAAF